MNNKRLLSLLLAAVLLAQSTAHANLPGWDSVKKFGGAWYKYFTGKMLSDTDEQMIKAPLAISTGAAAASAFVYGLSKEFQLVKTIKKGWIDPEEESSECDTNKRSNCIQLLAQAIAARMLASICLQTSAKSIEYKMPYTEEGFRTAVLEGKQPTVNDYLDNKRVGPNDLLCDDRSVLFHATCCNNLKTVQMLLHMGADPRLLKYHGKRVIRDEKEGSGRELVEPTQEILEALRAQARNLDSYGEKKCLELVLKKQGTPEILPPEMVEEIREFCAGPPYDTSTIPKHLREFHTKRTSGKIEDID